MHVTGDENGIHVVKPEARLDTFRVWPDKVLEGDVIMEVIKRDHTGHSGRVITSVQFRVMRWVI